MTQAFFQFFSSVDRFLSMDGDRSRIIICQKRHRISFDHLKKKRGCLSTCSTAKKNCITIVLASGLQ